jgi:capsular exopolysaccharide synthesis family protein
MSRLFKALSDLKTEVVSSEVRTPHEMASAAVSSPASRQAGKPEFQSLKVVQPTLGPQVMPQPEIAVEKKIQDAVAANPAQTVEIPAVMVRVSSESRLVAWTQPNSLGAEKFRALATRLDHMRSKREIKSFQITSSVINEGKTLVSGNIAVTLAKYSGSKTLLVEGDLRRPTLANLFGLSELSGLDHWWASADRDLSNHVQRLNGMPLWLLPAGRSCDQPSEILRSARFAKAFAQMAGQFEWTVVDSPPMLPVVDVNLWSKLVDGTLLVVREGIAPVKALKKGLQSLDQPKLIGVVINDASESGQVNYEGQYYDSSKSKGTRQ